MNDTMLYEIDGRLRPGETAALHKYGVFAPDCPLIRSLGKDGGMIGKDTEMYIQPFFILTDPEIARKLLAEGYALLDTAREAARARGHPKGALYLRVAGTGGFSGASSPGEAPCHVNGDLAWSVAAYYLATGDLEFIRGQGAEMVIECARFWLVTGRYDQGKFRIGGAEGGRAGGIENGCGKGIAKDCAEISARYNLYWAVRFYQMLQRTGALYPLAEKIDLCPEEIDAFGRAADSMYRPPDAAQAAGVFSIAASRQGFYDRVLRYLGDPGGPVFPGDYPDCVTGGRYMTIVYGFAGFRFQEGGVFLAPHLPRTWKSYRFRFRYRGSRIEVEVAREVVVVVLLSGKPQRIYVYGEAYEPAPALGIPLPG
jgi:trehalose/maltose hydrolase-like predicted phosphorylase